MAESDGQDLRPAPAGAGLIFGAGLWSAPVPAREVPFAAQQVISTSADFPRSVFAADIDGDGDLDVVSASRNDDEIAWYENTDGDGSFASQQVISTLAVRAVSVRAADVDGDGDLDVLSASSGDDEVAWYENTDGAGSFGSQQIISSLADFARSVVAADVDGDGDLDVLSASAGDDKIAWYENTDGAGSFGSEQIISSLADSANAMFAADVDGDGDLDVLSASARDDKIAWHENRGGQFALPTTPIAQGVLADSQEEAIFRIDLEHRGRDGDSAVELATIELRFEDGSSAALTSVQANNLIEKVEIFLDTGSGSFEPGSDTMIEQFAALDLTGGAATFDIPSGLSSQVAFGSSKSYFVVVTLTENAAAQTPDSFQAFHLIAASSTARDASVSTVKLSLEHTADATTGLIDTDLTTATCHAPFELDLEGFTVLSSVICEAGTVLVAGSGQVVSPGDLTLRAGQRVVLGVDFSVGTGGQLAVETDPALEP